MSLRVMVYSHDTFGLGNIRRMLAVAEELLTAIPGVSVLLVTGSPMIHEFRIRAGLDYIKLPCLSRIGREEYSAKSLGTDIGQLMQLRAGLITAAAREFEPDVLLVDKKPDGVKHELLPTLEYLRRERPACRVALVLRDILDAPKTTIATWKERHYERTLRQFFDSILILGDERVFDAAREYRFSANLRRRVKYCGYIRKAAPSLSACRELRRALLANGEEQLVLVTAGGGEDGCDLVKAYLAGMGGEESVRSVVVCGPEMPASEREAVCAVWHGNPRVTIQEFNRELMTYMAAADAVVSMAGYNTICEILSLGKRAVVVPRTEPVREQWIRADRLARMGRLSVVHPRMLTPQRLAGEVMKQLALETPPAAFLGRLDGLERIAEWVKSTSAEEPVAQESVRRLTWQAVASPTY